MLPSAATVSLCTSNSTVAPGSNPATSIAAIVPGAKSVWVVETVGPLDEDRLPESVIFALSCCIIEQQSGYTRRDRDSHAFDDLRFRASLSPPPQHSQPRSVRNRIPAQ